MTLAEYLNEHYQRNDHIRLGQRFVNDFIKHEWPELFYEKDDNTAIWMIEKWLQEHHYFKSLPEYN